MKFILHLASCRTKCPPYSNNYMYLLSQCPIARLFDGLTDRLENLMENRAVGPHNQTIVFNFEESDSIKWIAYDYLFLSLREQKSYAIGRAMGTKNQMESEQT